MNSSAKIRLDVLLVQRGLVTSRERAQAMLLAGRVLVNGQKMEKPGASVAQEAEIRLLGEDMPYVSRGGLKLAAALAHWKLNLDARDCMDIGASTGGFTDCMLQHGAARVFAVDTGYGQIAQRLRDDPRVELRERMNARYIEPPDLPFAPSFFAMDVSFISATLVLPPVVEAIRRNLFRPDEAAPGKATTLDGIILIKPQFEAGRKAVGSGGIVRDPAAHAAAIDRVRTCAANLAATQMDVIDSPITGAEGNREFLLYAQF